MLFYLVRKPGHFILKTGEFPSLDEAEVMVEGLRPVLWPELLDAGEYAGRYDVLDHEALVESISMAVKGDPNFVTLLPMLEAFTDDEAEALHYLLRSDFHMSLSEAASTAKARTKTILLSNRPSRSESGLLPVIR